MPNYVTNRLIFSGPAVEIERLRSNCIRPQRNRALDEVGFDFEALAPMPPEIVATLDDRSDVARTRALEATGFEGWYSWRLSSWGAKWNSSSLAILHAEPELLDFIFDTAWTSPEPIFRALAVARQSG